MRIHYPRTLLLGFCNRLCGAVRVLESAIEVQYRYHLHVEQTPSVDGLLRVNDGWTPLLLRNTRKLCSLVSSVFCSVWGKLIHRFLEVPYGLQQAHLTTCQEENNKKAFGLCFIFILFFLTVLLAIHTLGQSLPQNLDHMWGNICQLSQSNSATARNWVRTSPRTNLMLGHQRPTMVSVHDFIWSRKPFKFRKICFKSKNKCVCLNRYDQKKINKRSKHWSCPPNTLLLGVIFFRPLRFCLTHGASL